MYWFVVSKVACMAMADHQGDLTGTGKSGSSSIYEKERLPIQYSFQNPAVQGQSPSFCSEDKEIYSWLEKLFSIPSVTD